MRIYHSNLSFFCVCFFLFDIWPWSLNRPVIARLTYVIQTTCFLISLYWEINWKSISTTCLWLDLGAKMLFKQQMHGLKKGSNHDALPGIWSGGFQFHMRDLRKRYNSKCLNIVSILFHDVIVWWFCLCIVYIIHITSYNLISRS